jgi:hypothetical protein
MSGVQFAIDNLIAQGGPTGLALELHIEIELLE